MSTRNIRTPAADLHLVCDVCGRTLLRGERSHPYLEGGERRTVCELCTSRAQLAQLIALGVQPYRPRVVAQVDLVAVPAQLPGEHNPDGPR